jgi:cell division protein FtsL
MGDFLSWVTHGVKRGRFELDSRAAVALFAVVTALTLVTALYLALVSRTAAQGRYIEQLQAEVFRLQRENEQAMVEIAEASALSRVIGRAQVLGLAPAERVEFLTGSD